jgi:hypothetical protein
MPHPAVYPGNFNDLLKKWEEENIKDWNEDHDKLTFIANGQCARLVQELTSVGHTSRWQPGERVVDVARTLKPGTVIANFIFEYDKMWFPNSHNWHACLFVRGEGFSVVTGKPSRIVVFDQWIGKKKSRKDSHMPGIRGITAWTDEQAKARQKEPADNANEFFVVMVP